jgi:hypothetical protein
MVNSPGERVFFEARVHAAPASVEEIDQLNCKNRLLGGDIPMGVNYDF